MATALSGLDWLLMLFTSEMLQLADLMDLFMVSQDFTYQALPHADQVDLTRVHTDVVDDDKWHP